MRRYPSGVTLIASSNCLFLSSRSDTTVFMDTLRVELPSISRALSIKVAVIMAFWYALTCRSLFGVIQSRESCAEIYRLADKAFLMWSDCSIFAFNRSLCSISVTVLFDTPYSLAIALVVFPDDFLSVWIMILSAWVNLFAFPCGLCVSAGNLCSCDSIKPCGLHFRVGLKG